MPLLTISEKVFLLICSIGVLQGILLAILLFFHPKSDRKVNRYLSFYIFFFSLVMTLPFTLQFGTWHKSFFQQPIPLLTGPFLYLYLRSFKETISFRKAAPHFIFFFVYFVPVYMNVSHWATKYPDATQVPTEMLHSPVTIILNYIKMGQSVFYYFLAHRTLRTYQHSINQLYSETSRINLNWARLLVNGYMTIVVMALALFALIIRFPQHFYLLLLIIMAVSTPYIYIVTYKGILQPSIWQVKPELTKITSNESTPIQEMEDVIPLSKTNLKKENVVDTKLEEIAGRIIDLMENDKLYQEPELTLQQLADKIQLPTYQVSQSINEGLSKSFYDLINGYRVEEAKRLLMEDSDRNYTILSVGFEAGFNSKTTFNTVFKKFTGLTPTEFRNKQQERIADTVMA